MSDMYGNDSPQPWEAQQSQWNTDQGHHRVEEVQDAEEDDNLSAVFDEDVEAVEEEPSAEPATESESPYSAPISVPANVRNEVIFSEKDIYRIINALITLESCDERMSAWLGLALNINGQNIRKSMTLVKMDQSEFEDRIALMDSLASIGELSTKGADDPIQAVLSTISRVAEMDAATKTLMISVVRRMNKDLNNGHRVRGAKTASDVDIVKDIQASMTGESGIADSVAELQMAMKALSEAIK